VKRIRFGKTAKVYRRAQDILPRLKGDCNRGGTLATPFYRTNQFEWQMAATKAEPERNIARALKISLDGKV